MNASADRPIDEQTLLLVDDNPDNLVALEAILEQPGRCLVCAGSGNQALALALRHDIALILLDVQMPEMDGFEVAELLHRNRHTREIPVIFCTAISKEAKYVHRGMDSGAIDYLFKPIDPVVLGAKVSALLELDRQKRRLRRMNEDLTAARNEALAAQEALRAAGRHMQAILDGAPAWIVATDIGGTVRFGNGKSGSAVGAVPPGGDLLRAFPPPAQAAVADAMMRAMASRRTVPLELAIGGGERGHVELACEFAPLPGDGDSDEIAGCVLVAHDVTATQRLRRELDSSQRLATVGSLAAGVAHEINTPVQFVGDSVHFLRDAVGDLLGVLAAIEPLRESARECPCGDALSGALASLDDAVAAADVDYLREQVPRAIERALDGLDRVAGIVRAMKEFSHPGGKEMAPSDLNRAIDSTLTVGRNEYKYVADLETDFGELPAVMCHVADINQVVLNIVVNAAHAIGDLVAGSDRRGLIHVRTRTEGDHACIDIRDTGGGIPEAIRTRVFDPFFTTKEVGRGTGQGLAIAWAIVCEKHGGTLTFDSRPGDGTTFHIRLPVKGPARTEATS